jgi:hypothetical protein
MFYLSSLVNSLSAWRCSTAASQSHEPASATDTAPVDHSASSFSAQDMYVCDAHLDDFLEVIPGELTLIDLACLTVPPSQIT